MWLTIICLLYVLGALGIIIVSREINIIRNDTCLDNRWIKIVHIVSEQDKFSQEVWFYGQSRSIITLPGTLILRNGFYQLKFINPSEISGKIITLLEESDERVIIVSPYMKISKWYKLLHKLIDLKTKSIPVEIFVRDDYRNEETYQDLDQMELEYHKIPHLHSKLYLNEKYGIVTSMNLLLSSEINSLEIGYLTETNQELDELIQYYHRYINTVNPVNLKAKAGQLEEIRMIIAGIQAKLVEFDKDSWIWLDKNVLHINMGTNNYSAYIAYDGAHVLKVFTLINQREYDLFSRMPGKIEKLTSMNIEIHPDVSSNEPQNKKNPTRQKLLRITGQTERLLKSTCITRVLETEVDYIIYSIIRFTIAVDELRY